MNKDVAVAIGLVVMVSAIVGVDFAFFRDRFGARLLANVAIVVAFALLYLTVLRHL